MECEKDISKLKAAKLYILKSVFSKKGVRAKCLI